MKKYVIAAGVTSLLIAAQAMASDAASLVGAPETAVAPAETASAPAAVARAVSNAPARPLMVAGEAGALSATSVAVPVGAEVTATGLLGSASRVPDRVATSYNASLNLSTTQTASQCSVDTQKDVMGRLRTVARASQEGLTAEQCEALRASQDQLLSNIPGILASGAVFTAAIVVVTNDNSASGS
jgi:hypothetical protein